MLRTFSWVSSKLIYPKVNPANTPERRTRIGMRHPKTIFLVSESSSRLAYVWRTWPASVTEVGTAGKTEVMTEGRKSDRTALLLTKRRPRPVETLITIRMHERINSQPQPEAGWAQGGDYHKRKVFPMCQISGGGHPTNNVQPLTRIKDLSTRHRCTIWKCQLTLTRG